MEQWFRTRQGTSAMPAMSDSAAAPGEGASAWRGAAIATDPSWRRHPTAAADIAQAPASGAAPQPA